MSLMGDSRNLLLGMGNSKEGRKASSPRVEGGECWAAEQSVPGIGLFLKRA